MATPLIVDGNALVTRSLWGGLKEEIKYGLRFTSGIHGTLNTLGRVAEHHKVQAGQIVAFFDHVPPLRRLRLVPDYKKGRRRHWVGLHRERLDAGCVDEDEADELRPFESARQRASAFAQIEQVYRLLPLLGVTTLCYREREADDGVAAAARVFLERGQRPVIVTGDHDLWQAVGWGAAVWDLGRARIVDTGNFFQHAGCATDTYTLYRALTGDPSDCIKGAHGFGPKRAKKLLERAHWYVRSVRDPREQLHELCRFLRKQKSRSSAETALLDDRDRLDRVVRAIDLRRSFGPTRALEARLAERPEVQRREFALACRALGVAVSPARFLRPFLQAEALRNREKAHAKGRKGRCSGIVWPLG